MTTYIRPVLAALAVVLVFSLSGCMGCFTSDSEDEVTSEGSNINNPLGALGALGELANKAKGLSEELENMTPVDPVHYDVLIAALPDVPDGYTAGDPAGKTNSMGDFKMSTASRTYEGEGKKIEVAISDYAFNKALYIPFSMAAAFSSESTEGYDKGITVGEDPGREEYKNAARRGERQVLFRKRFHSAVKGSGIDAEDLDHWYKLIKKDELPAE